MMKRLLPLLFLLMLAACTKKDAPPAAAEPKELNVYTWSNYFAPEVIEEFEKKSGAKVRFSYFSSNEELLAKLQAGAKGYDVIVPSGYVVRAMKSLGLLEPLGEGAIPETKNLLPQFQSPPFDPKLEYVTPFSWGITGLGVNKNRVKGDVDSWSWVFEHPELKGQITMLDDGPTVIGAALKKLGHSFNSDDTAALNQAKELLKKQKPLLKAYTSETIPLLESGDVAIAQSYSTDVGQVSSKHPNIQFVIPKEGGEIWVDNLAIPKGAPAPGLAKDFMRFILQPSVAERQSKHLFTNPVVQMPEGSDVMKKLRSLGLIPTDAQLKTLEYMSDDPGHHDRVTRIWTELKAE